ncbi:hypothetical protein QQP08_005942 [Theobroma cacao]|nr:hypothetical protein QQP08_005942 [Theobroma cacao]
MVGIVVKGINGSRRERKGWMDVEIKERGFKTLGEKINTVSGSLEVKRGLLMREQRRELLLSPKMTIASPAFPFPGVVLSLVIPGVIRGREGWAVFYMTSETAYLREEGRKERRNAMGDLFFSSLLSNVLFNELRRRRGHNAPGNRVPEPCL